MKEVDPAMTIGELLELYPEAAGVFIKRRMLCVGCPTEAYHTLEDASRLYGCSLDALRGDIHAAVRETREDRG